MRITKKLISFFAYGNIVISIGTACQIWLSCLLLNIPIDFHLVTFSFFSTLLVYHGATAFNPEANRFHPANEREHWMFHNKWFVYFFIGVSTLSLAYLSFFLELNVILLGFGLGVVSLFYNFPINFKRTGFRFREIPGFKIILISLVWTATTVWMPLLQVEQFERVEVIWLSLQRFCFLMAITLPFDIRDVKMDERRKLHTIPIVIGDRSSELLTILFLAISFVSVIPLFAIESHLTIFAVSICYLITLYLLGKKAIKRDEIYYLIYLDGTLVLPFLLYFSLQYFTSL